MDSEPKDEAKVNRTDLPDYLSRESKENPVFQLRDLIFKKIQDIHFFNDTGIKLMDDLIMHTFDTVLDQRRQGEVAEDMKRFKKGRRLSREGIEYKKDMEDEFWQQNPVLKFADLLVIKSAGMDALSDEELDELDRLIQDTYKEACGIKKQRSDWLMDQYFAAGRKLPPMAIGWLEDRPSKPDPRQNIAIILEEERQLLEVDTQTT